MRRAHEVAQLGARQRLIFEVVVALDVGISQQGAGLLEDRLEIDASQLDMRSAGRFAHCAFDVGVCSRLVHDIGEERGLSQDAAPAPGIRLLPKHLDDVAPLPDGDGATRSRSAGRRCRGG